MTVLKERAIGIIEQMTDEQVSFLITFMEDYKNNSEKSKEAHLAKSRAAYQNLQKYRKKGFTDNDYKKDITEGIEKKYESIS